MAKRILCQECCISEATEDFEGVSLCQECSEMYLEESAEDGFDSGVTSQVCERCGKRPGELNSRFSFSVEGSSFDCGDWVCYECEEELERDRECPCGCGDNPALCAYSGQ